MKKTDTDRQTDNVRINVTLKRVSETTIALEKQ